MNITVISGSTRKERKSHQVAIEILHRLNLREDAHAVMLDIREFDFPNLGYIYSKHPSQTEKMKYFSETIFKSDGIVIISPEYNGSFSGALKNTLDYFSGEYKKKVMGVVTVSTGKFGGVRAAMDLQKLILAFGAYPLPRYVTTPEVHNVFNNGILVDEAYAKRLDGFLDEFLWLTEAVKNQKTKQLEKSFHMV